MTKYNAYIPKFVVVEAIQYNGTDINVNEIKNLELGKPREQRQKYRMISLTHYDDPTQYGKENVLGIETNHSQGEKIMLSIGDWVIKYPDCSYGFLNDETFKERFTKNDKR